MEFGNTPQPQGSPEITDAARLEASSRLRTVAPAHETVTPDELSDEQVVTQHTVQPAVANLVNDTEFTEGDHAENIIRDNPHRVMLTIIVSATMISAALITSFYLMFL